MGCRLHGAQSDDAVDTPQAGGWRDLKVEVGYDPASDVYYVISSDIPGLNIETPTFEALVEVATDAAADLVDEIDGRTRISFRRTVALMPSDRQ